MFRIVFFLHFLLKFRVEKKPEVSFDFFFVASSSCKTPFYFVQICFSVNFDVLTSVLGN